MASLGLKNIKLGYSPLSDSIVLYRHGKDRTLALDKRDAEAEVMSVLVQYMMAGAPNGSEKDFRINGKSYTLRLIPKDEPEADQQTER